MGTHKITISRAPVLSNGSDEKKDVSVPTHISLPVPEVIGDLMDIRNIPNQVMFPRSNDQTRGYGNGAVNNRSFSPNSETKFDSDSKLNPGFKGVCKNILEHDLTELHEINIGDTWYTLPLYVIKSMIMGHVKKIIDFRSSDPADPDPSDPKNLVMVPHSSGPKNIFFESMGSELILGAHNEAHKKSKIGSKISSKIKRTIEPISSVNALTLEYLERNILSVPELDLAQDIPNKNVLIVDIGQSKSTFFSFSCSRTQGKVLIKQHLFLVSEKLSGSHIDDLLCQHLAQRLNELYPSFRINKSNDKNYAKNRSFRSGVQKLKHQLTTNQQVIFTVQGIENDVSFPVTRGEFESLLQADDLKDLIHGSLEYFNYNQSLAINHLEIVGGSARIPWIRETIRGYYGKSHDITFGSLNQDESVGNGACVYGWLLEHPEITRNIRFSRPVRNQTTIEWLNKKSILYHHYYELLTSFRGMNLTETRSMSETQGTDTSDIRMTHIDPVNIFSIVTGDLCMNLRILSPVDSSYNEFITVHTRYGMADIVDVLGITDSEGNALEFVIENVYGYHLTDPMTKRHGRRAVDLVKSFDASKRIETEILNKEAIIERRQNVCNFMESYYLDSGTIDQMIRRINKSKSKSKSKGNDIPEYVAPIQSVRDTPTEKLESPLEELHGFFQFCKAFIEEPMDRTEKAKQQYVIKTLHDDEALVQLEKAIQIVKNIQRTYGEN